MTLRTRNKTPMIDCDNKHTETYIFFIKKISGSVRVNTLRDNFKRNLFVLKNK